MTIDIPDPSLILLIGPSGSGKTTFARRHFQPTEILSSDAFRALVADDEEAPDAGSDAFQALRFVAAKRLRRGRLTVIDATNVRASARKGFIAMARRHQVPAVGFVFDLPASVGAERNRRHRALPAEVIAQQAAALHQSVALLSKEGCASVYRLESEATVDAVVIDRHQVAPPASRGDDGDSNSTRQLDLLGAYTSDELG